MHDPGIGPGGTPLSPHLRLGLILAVVALAFGWAAGSAEAQGAHHSRVSSRPAVKAITVPNGRAITLPKGTHTLVVRTPGPSGWDAATIAQVVAAGVAIIALLLLVAQTRGLGIQTREQGKDARADRTLSYQAIYAGHEFRTTAAKCTGFFQAEDAATCVDKIRSFEATTWAGDPSLLRTPPSVAAANASKIDIAQVLGFFETLGAAYNRKLIDQQLIEKTFVIPAAYFLCDAWWYLCWLRKGKSAEESKLYDQFELFVRAVLVQRKALARNAKPNSKVRLLCLPPDGATAYEWEGAASVSRALSERAAGQAEIPETLVIKLRQEVEKIERARGHGIASPESGIETVIAIPDTFASNAQVWGQHQTRAREIQPLLARLSSGEVRQVAERIQTNA